MRLYVDKLSCKDVVALFNDLLPDRCIMLDSGNELFGAMVNGCCSVWGDAVFLFKNGGLVWRIDGSVFASCHVEDGSVVVDKFSFNPNEDDFNGSFYERIYCNTNAFRDMDSLSEYVSRKAELISCGCHLA